MKLTNNSIYILKRICYDIPCEYKLTGKECVEATISLQKQNLISCKRKGFAWKVSIKGRWLAFRYNE